MKKLIVIVVAGFIACPGLSLAGDNEHRGDLPAANSTTVKSSKSNSSERYLKIEDPRGEKNATGQPGAAGLAVSDEGAPADKKPAAK